MISKRHILLSAAFLLTLFLIFSFEPSRLDPLLELFLLGFFALLSFWSFREIDYDSSQAFAMISSLLLVLLIGLRFFGGFLFTVVPEDIVELDCTIHSLTSSESICSKHPQAMACSMQYFCVKLQLIAETVAGVCCGFVAIFLGKKRRLMEVEKTLTKIAKWSFIGAILLLLFYLIAPVLMSPILDPIMKYMIQNDVLGFQETFGCDLYRDSCCQVGFNKTVEMPPELNKGGDIRGGPTDLCESSSSIVGGLFFILLFLSIVSMMIVGIMEYLKTRERDVSGRKAASKK